MNLISWNCRGTKAKGFRGLVKDLCALHSASFLILLETQLSGVSADKIIDDIGFDGHAKVDATGRSGGIWCLWDSSLWTVQVTYSTSQHLSMQLRWKAGAPWLLTAVYGSPRYAQRGSL